MLQVRAFISLNNDTMVVLFNCINHLVNEKLNLTANDNITPCCKHFIRKRTGIGATGHDILTTLLRGVNKS